MITDDGREASDDIQATDAGDEDPNYAVPFGVPEDKATALGLRDPRIVEPPPWNVVRPSKLTRLKIWIHKNFYRPWL